MSTITINKTIRLSKWQKRGLAALGVIAAVIAVKSGLFSRTTVINVFVPVPSVAV